MNNLLPLNQAIAPRKIVTFCSHCKRPDCDGRLFRAELVGPGTRCSNVYCTSQTFIKDGKVFVKGEYFDAEAKPILNGESTEEWWARSQ